MKEQERNYTPIGVFMAFVFVGLLWLIIGVFIGRSVESKRSKPKTEIIENEEKATYYVDKLVYKSKVFSFTPDYTDVINSYRIISGGTGYAIKGAGGEHYDPQLDKPLADEVEHICPDYSIYGIKDTAYGYLTRGCPRGCSFCIVAKKEGKCSCKVADLSEFWSGQRNIVLNDPNILACPQRDELIGQLVASRAWVDFNQGLDARMITDDGIAQRLASVKTKEVHFAWDRYEDKDKILPRFEIFWPLADTSSL